MFYWLFTDGRAALGGCLAPLLVMGDLASLPLLAAGAGLVLATAWARIVTGHHTVAQVSLGVVVSVVSVATAAILFAAG